MQVDLDEILIADDDDDVVLEGENISASLDMEYLVDF